MSADPFVTALWANDPAFVGICKGLWGDDVDLDSVLAEIAKDGPTSADVHIPGHGNTRKPKEVRSPRMVTDSGIKQKVNESVTPIQEDEAKEATSKRLYSKKQARFMFANHPEQAKEMADSMKTKTKKHPLKGLPEEVDKREAIAKILSTAVAQQKLDKETALRIAKDWSEYDQARNQRRKAGAQGLAAAGGGAATLATLASDALKDGKAKTVLRHGGLAAAAVGAAGAVGLGAELLHEHNTRPKAKRAVSDIPGQTQYAKRDDVVWAGEISKVVPDKQQVFGWASIVEKGGEPVYDRQGDFIAPDEIESAAYTYVLESRVGGDMHRRVTKADSPFHASDLIESMVFTPEKIEKMGLPSDFPVGWWVGFKINDPETWQAVKDGERTGFSIHGIGKRTPMPHDPRVELLGKAFSYAETAEEAVENLHSIARATGDSIYVDMAKAYGGFGGGGMAEHTGLDNLGANGLGRHQGLVGQQTAPIGARNAAPPVLAQHGLGRHCGKLAMGSMSDGMVGKKLGGANLAPDMTRQSQMLDAAMMQATQMLTPQVAQHVSQLQAERSAQLQQEMMQQQMYAQQVQQVQQTAAQIGQMQVEAMGNMQQGEGAQQPMMGPPMAGMNPYAVMMGDYPNDPAAQMMPGQQRPEMTAPAPQLSQAPQQGQQKLKGQQPTMAGMPSQNGMGMGMPQNPTQPQKPKVQRPQRPF